MAGQGSVNGHRTISDELPIPMVLKGKLRAQFPDSPIPSLASSVSSARGFHYTNKGYENTESLGHDYEDISHLTVPHGQRRHANPVYEATTLPTKCPLNDTSRRIRQDTERSEASTTSNDSFSYPYPKESRVNKVILGLIFGFSLTALVIVVLMVFGVIGPKCACSNPDTTTKAQAIRSSISIEPLLTRIRALEKNMTAMREVKEYNDATVQEGKIIQLEAKLKAMEAKLSKTSDTVKRNVTGLENKILTEMQGLRSQQVQVKSAITTLKNSDSRKAVDIGKLKTSSERLAVAVQFLNRSTSALGSEVRTLVDAKSRLMPLVQKLGEKDEKMRVGFSKLRMGVVRLNASVAALRQADVNFGALLLQMNSSLNKKISELSQAPSKSPVTPAPSPSAAGNLISQCVFTSDETPARSGTTFNSFKTLVEEKDKVVIGVSCSTEGGDDTLLEKLTSQGRTYYKCTCRGLSSYRPTPGSSKCRISGWVCPRYS